MSLVFPGFIFQDKQPLDPDWVNKSTLDFYRELSTCLNEQNFARHAIAPMACIDKTQIVQWVSDSKYVPITNTDPATEEYVNTKYLINKNIWSDLDLEINITTRGGLLHIFGSFYFVSVDVNTGINQPNPGIKFALKIDGQVIVESLVGSGDTEQDITSFKLATGSLPSDPDELLTGINSDGFISKGRDAINVDYQAYLPAGDHVIKIAACLISYQDYTNTTYYKICNRELTAIEFTR